MAFTWAPKDPDETLDYHHDWSDRLLVNGEDVGDAITGDPEVIIESGDVELVEDSTVNGSTQVVWLTGGTLDDGDPRECRLTLRIHTTGGRTYDEGIKLKIKER